MFIKNRPKRHNRALSAQNPPSIHFVDVDSEDEKAPATPSSTASSNAPLLYSPKRKSFSKTNPSKTNRKSLAVILILLLGTLWWLTSPEHPNHVSTTLTDSTPSEGSPSLKNLELHLDQKALKLKSWLDKSSQIIASSSSSFYSSEYASLKFWRTYPLLCRLYGSESKYCKSGSGSGNSWISHLFETSVFDPLPSPIDEKEPEREERGGVWKFKKLPTNKQTNNRIEEEGEEREEGEDDVPAVREKFIHPIFSLIKKSRKEWDDKLNAQSLTLEDAVHEYQRRYGMNPPKGFDTWSVRNHSPSIPVSFSLLKVSMVKIKLCQID
jgi:hypothetical protein